MQTPSGSSLCILYLFILLIIQSFKVDFPPNSKLVAGENEREVAWAWMGGAILFQFLILLGPLSLKVREEIHKFLSYLEDALSLWAFAPVLSSFLVNLILNVKRSTCRWLL